MNSDRLGNRRQRLPRHLVLDEPHQSVCHAQRAVHFGQRLQESPQAGCASVTAACHLDADSHAILRGEVSKGGDLSAMSPERGPVSACRATLGILTVPRRDHNQAPARPRANGLVINMPIRKVERFRHLGLRDVGGQDQIFGLSCCYRTLAEAAKSPRTLKDWRSHRLKSIRLFVWDTVPWQCPSRESDHFGEKPGGSSDESDWCRSVRARSEALRIMMENSIESSGSGRRVPRACPSAVRTCDKPR